MSDESGESPLSSREAEALRALRQPIAPSATASAALREAIRRHRGFRSATRWWVPATVAAALLIGFFAGRIAESPVPAGAHGSQYVMALLNAPAPTWPAGTSDEQIVSEYRDWSVRLAREGRLTVAEELDTTMILVDSSGTRTGAAADAIGGLFIVRAPDDSSAAAVAATLPHVRQGGVVAVQRLTTR